MERIKDIKQIREELHQKNVGFLNSIKFKVSVMVALTLACAVIFNLVIIIGNVKGIIGAENQQYLSKITAVCIGCAVVAIVIFSVATYFVVQKMLSPIAVLAQNISKMADMDFTPSESEDALLDRKDEFGVMSSATCVLRQQLLEVVTKIREQSKALYTASDTLDSSARETTATIGQVENAVGDIAEGATNQAEETQSATENVIEMGSMIEETTDEVASLKRNAAEMQNYSDEAQRILAELVNENVKTRASIDEIYRQTNTTNESALKIKEATELIRSISEETNLLSLNASIEAARAGEQGRGFAVVAAQIQKLADQSSESARKIEEITNSLIEDSSLAVSTMAVVKENMDVQSKKMDETNHMFASFNSGVVASINGVENIAIKTENLDGSRVKVVDLVSTLSAIAQQNAASSQETSASVSQVSEIITAISSNANRLKCISNDLEQAVEVFKI